MAKAASLTSNFSDKFKNCVDSKLAVDSEWNSLKKTPGVEVWRIRKFQLEKVQDNEVGTFYDGDSYIILHTYEKSKNCYGYNVYIWIGKNSSSDEYGTAAYKMAELDLDILKDMAVQHREVQGHESDKFLTIFEKVTFLKGGYETGYNKVKEEEATQKLYHISGVKKNISVTEVSYRKDNINNEDVFILDLGTKIYQINGKACSKEEKFKGAQILNDIKSRRGKCVSEIIDDYTVGSINSVIDSIPTKNKSNILKVNRREISYSLWKVSDESGKLTISLVKKEKASKSDLCSNDVFLYDTNEQIYVWIGKSTSRNEKMCAMVYAQKYADGNGRELSPIEKVNEGNETAEFLSKLS